MSDEKPKQDPQRHKRDMLMCRMYLEGNDLASIAKKFDVDHSWVYRISVRDNWQLRRDEMRQAAFGAVAGKYKDIAVELSDIIIEDVKRLRIDLQKSPRMLTDGERNQVRLMAQFVMNDTRLEDGKPTVNVHQTEGKRVYVMPKGTLKDYPSVFGHDPAKLEIIEEAPEAEKQKPIPLQDILNATEDDKPDENT